MFASCVRRAGVRGYVLLAILVTALVAVQLCLAGEATAGLLTERVSVSGSGTEANGWSGDAVITPDGRYVVFSSAASNLIVGDTNSQFDIFLKDRQSGAVSRVNVPQGHAQALGGGSEYPAISPDGRFVVFGSGADNLVSSDTNGKYDVFIRDRTLGITQRVSVATGGHQALGADSMRGAVSADGRFVAFESGSAGLVEFDSNASIDVFLRDRQENVTIRVNVGPGGAQATGGHSGDASISGDGRYVAFESGADNLVSGDHLGKWDVFVHDRLTGVTTCVSLAPTGVHANDHSGAPSISADGRFVAFQSAATNLVAGDTGGKMHIYVYDRVGRVMRRASMTWNNALAGSHSQQPVISSDGRYVAFVSEATNLVAGDTNGVNDIFVRDMTRRTTRRVSVRSDGVQANWDCWYPSVTADGKRATFYSGASNLVSGDGNGVDDVFVNTGPASTVRISDRTRFSTALAIARDGFPDWAGVTHVVIASGDDRAAADPLAASGLCWAYDAPMLLVSAARTPDEVKTAIHQIVSASPSGKITLHVVGGPVSVPDARLAELQAAGSGPAKVQLDRILATGNRYDLARAIALRMKSVAAADPGKTMPKTALFANGADSTKFFDALALSPISAGTGAPILLVTATSVPPATQNAITSLAPTTKIVGGGPNTVSEAVRSQLGATRWSGRSRYDTAIAIAEGAVAKKWLTRSHVGLAAKLPDALTGGSLIGKRKGVLLLTDGAALTPATKTWLTSHKWEVSEVCLFGGPLSISEAVKTQVGNALK